MPQTAGLPAATLYAKLVERRCPIVVHHTTDPEARSIDIATLVIKPNELIGGTGIAGFGRRETDRTNAMGARNDDIAQAIHPPSKEHTKKHYYDSYRCPPPTIRLVD